MHVVLTNQKRGIFWMNNNGHYSLPSLINSFVSQAMKNAAIHCITKNARLLPCGQLKVWRLRQIWNWVKTKFRSILITETKSGYHLNWIIFLRTPSRNFSTFYQIYLPWRHISYSMVVIYTIPFHVVDVGEGVLYSEVRWQKFNGTRLLITLLNPELHQNPWFWCLSVGNC